jgi:hypothetical protein
MTKAQEPGNSSNWLPKVAPVIPNQTTTNEPAPSGPGLLAEIEQYIRRYVVLPAAAYLPLAIWAMATHLVERFDCFPYLAVVSAAKRCGKTRLAEVLELLVRRPWRGTAPSPAALYRMLEGAPTLFLDEVEIFRGRDKSETTQIILAVLNAGHRRGATIPRCEGPRQEVRHFPVYGPKLFAAIGRLPDTLMDRSIVIHMTRRTKAQQVARFRMARATAEAKPIRENAARFAQTYAAAVDEAYNRVLDADLDFLGDRDADLWTPLFSVCTVADPARLSTLRVSALALSASKAGDDLDDSYSLTLLKDIRTVWIEGDDKCETGTLLGRLKALEESPWVEECPLTPRKLAKMLKPFGVIPRTIRTEDHTAKGYFWEHLEAATSPYLEDLSVTCVTNQ